MKQELKPTRPDKFRMEYEEMNLKFSKTFYKKTITMKFKTPIKVNVEVGICKDTGRLGCIHKPQGKLLSKEMDKKVTENIYDCMLVLYECMCGAGTREEHIETFDRYLKLPEGWARSIVKRFRKTHNFLEIEYPPESYYDEEEAEDNVKEK